MYYYYYYCELENIHVSFCTAALESLEEPQDTALLSSVMASLSTEEIPNLPPGGGLHAK